MQDFFAVEGDGNVFVFGIFVNFVASALACKNKTVFVKHGDYFFGGKAGKFGHIMPLLEPLRD